MKNLTCAIMMVCASTVAACSQVEKAANASANEAGNGASGSNTAAAPTKSLKQQYEEKYPTRELARQAYDERIECAAQAEAVKRLTAQQVQAAPMGATRDRLVSEENGASGRAGATAAISSGPALVLGLTMAETTESIERRAAAIVRERGSTPLDSYVERQRDEVETCYERLSG